MEWGISGVVGAWGIGSGGLGGVEGAMGWGGFVLEWGVRGLWGLGGWVKGFWALEVDKAGCGGGGGDERGSGSGLGVGGMRGMGGLGFGVQSGCRGTVGWGWGGGVLCPTRIPHLLLLRPLPTSRLLRATFPWRCIPVSIPLHCSLVNCWASISPAKLWEGLLWVCGGDVGQLCSRAGCSRAGCSAGGAAGLVAALRSQQGSMQQGRMQRWGCSTQVAAGRLAAGQGAADSPQLSVQRDRAQLCCPPPASVAAGPAKPRSSGSSAAPRRLSEPPNTPLITPRCRPAVLGALGARGMQSSPFVHLQS